MSAELMDSVHSDGSLVTKPGYFSSYSIAVKYVPYLSNRRVGTVCYGRIRMHGLYGYCEHSMTEFRERITYLFIPWSFSISPRRCRSVRGSTKERTRTLEEHGAHPSRVRGLLKPMHVPWSTKRRWRDEIRIIAEPLRVETHCCVSLDLSLLHFLHEARVAHLASRNVSYKHVMTRTIVPLQHRSWSLIARKDYAQIWSVRRRQQEFRFL